jgi:heme-degrading monooxygenase HmoA
MTKPFPPLKPPYFAAIFTSVRKPGQEGYDEMSEEMLRMVQAQPGFLGFDSARAIGGFGITVSYWKDLESIRAWKQVPKHLEAQKNGRDQWYSHFSVRIAEVLEDRGPSS